MGYQALLFCPDEKLARVVSQVFSELDFTVEPVHEPFAAVKKLMSQRYDAIVVDCENEQNASLLFKSARNSSSNQSSLAIALVEGQAGVAKAYRIGANLVLTKPINVEQAKGTLRVARGLLRKNSDAASASAASAAAPAMPAKTAPLSAGSSFQPPSRDAAASAPPLSRQELPEFEAAASGDDSGDTSGGDFPQFQRRQKLRTNRRLFLRPRRKPNQDDDRGRASRASVAARFLFGQLATTQSRMPYSRTKQQNRRLVRIGPKFEFRFRVGPGIRRSTSSGKRSNGSASASEREQNRLNRRRPVHPTPVHLTPICLSSIDRTMPAPAPAPRFSMVSAIDAPSFAALGEEDSGGSGGNKKILIAAVAVLALAALGYVGYGKLGKSSTQPASTPQDSGAARSCCRRRCPPR